MPETILALARGLDLPPEMVFRVVVKLPASPPTEESVEVLHHRFMELTEDDRAQVIQFMEFVSERHVKAGAVFTPGDGR